MEGRYLASLLTPAEYSDGDLVCAKWNPKAPLIWSSMKPGDMMAFWRSIVSVSLGRGEFGIMSPSDEMVRGEETRVPLMHNLLLTKCVAIVN